MDGVVKSTGAAFMILIKLEKIPKLKLNTKIKLENDLKIFFIGKLYEKLYLETKIYLRKNRTRTMKTFEMNP